MATVLLVEDDTRIRARLTRAFTDAGHVVSGVGTALEALREVAVHRPEIVVLDLGLPDMDGTVVLRMIRGESNVPVIVASGRTGEATAIKLLNAGADDFIVKPFSSAHLLARVGAVLRRPGTAPATPALIEVGPLRIDPGRRTAALDGRRLDLTRKEFDVLAYLAARPDQVVPAKELYEKIWHQLYRSGEPTLRVHVSWLRRKLGETAAQPRMLRTVWGVGLMVQVPG